MTGKGERQGGGLLPTPAPQREEVPEGSSDVSSLWRGSWRNSPHILSRILHLREVRDWFSFQSCSLPSNKLSFLSPLWKLWESFEKFQLITSSNAKVNFPGKKISDCAHRTQRALHTDSFTATHTGRCRPSTSVQHPDVSDSPSRSLGWVISFKVPKRCQLPEALVHCWCALWDPQCDRVRSTLIARMRRGWISVGGRKLFIKTLWNECTGQVLEEVCDPNSGRETGPFHDPRNTGHGTPWLAASPPAQAAES